MNERTKQFWIPVLVTVAAATAYFTILTQISLQSHMLLLRSKFALLLYPVWLVAQPLFGAVGAYISGRGGARRSTRVAVALFPSILLLTFFCLGLGASLAFGRPFFAKPQWFYFATAAVFMGILPGMALFIGAVPFMGPGKVTGTIAS